MGRLIDADDYLAKERPRGVADDIWEESLVIPYPLRYAKVHCHAIALHIFRCNSYTLPLAPK